MKRLARILGLFIFAAVLVGGLLFDDSPATAPDADLVTAPVAIQPLIERTARLTTTWYCPGVPASGAAGEVGQITVVNPSETPIDALLTVFPLGAPSISRPISVGQARPSRFQRRRLRCHEIQRCDGRVRRGRPGVGRTDRRHCRRHVSLALHDRPIVGMAVRRWIHTGRRVAADHGPQSVPHGRSRRLLVRRRGRSANVETLRRSGDPGTQHGIVRHRRDCATSQNRRGAGPGPRRTGGGRTDPDLWWRGQRPSRGRGGSRCTGGGSGLAVRAWSDRSATRWRCSREPAVGLFQSR